MELRASDSPTVVWFRGHPNPVQCSRCTRDGCSGLCSRRHQPRQEFSTSRAQSSFNPIQRALCKERSHGMSKVFQMSKERTPEGSIRWVRSKKPVPGGRWFIDYTDYAGKQIRSATSASTKREALRILRARMGEQARAEAAGVHPQALTMTLEKFLDDVYLPHARVTLRPSTAKSYQAHAPLRKEHFGGKLLSAVPGGTRSVSSPSCSGEARPTPRTSWRRRPSTGEYPSSGPCSTRPCRGSTSTAIRRRGSRCSPRRTPAFESSPP